MGAYLMLGTIGFLALVMFCMKHTKKGRKFLEMEE